MAKTKRTSSRHRTEPEKHARPPGGMGVALVIGATVMMVAAGIFWFSQMRSASPSTAAPGGPGVVPAAVLDAAKTKGNPNAPVLVEEWSDFQ
jgi:hypothetical protein